METPQLVTSAAAAAAEKFSPVPPTLNALMGNEKQTPPPEQLQRFRRQKLHDWRHRKRRLQQRQENEWRCPIG